MKYSEFIAKYKGNKIDYDGMYGVQCVDFIDRYIVDVLGLRVGFWGNARLWWVNRFKSDWLQRNFYFITPTYKYGELRKGDIGIRTSGTYGHIFIIDDKNSGGKFSYYDENGTGNGDAVKLRSYPYTATYINGVLRPKNQSNIDAKAIYGNAYITSDCNTFSSTNFDFAIGSLFKGDRVCKLGTANGNPMVSYQIKGGYKVGIINKKYLKED